MQHYRGWIIIEQPFQTSALSFYWAFEGQTLFKYCETISLYQPAILWSEAQSLLRPLPKIKMIPPRTMNPGGRKVWMPTQMIHRQDEARTNYNSNQTIHTYRHPCYHRKIATPKPWVWVWLDSLCDHIASIIFCSHGILYVIVSAESNCCLQIKQTGRLTLWSSTSPFMVQI